MIAIPEGGGLVADSTVDTVALGREGATMTGI